MFNFSRTEAKATNRDPWNKGKLIGQKPPLQPKHVWAIRTRLQLANKVRDLALFNLAIDSKLRGCDVVSLKVDDIGPHGYAVDRATVRQKKTGRPVKFEITDQTRQAIDDYLRIKPKKTGDFLFSGRGGQCRCLTTRQYSRLVSQWVELIGLDPLMFGTLLNQQKYFVDYFCGILSKLTEIYFCVDFDIEMVLFTCLSFLIRTLSIPFLLLIQTRTLFLVLPRILEL